jgi:imidazolonepropionase-like amidohydrolase
MKFVLRGTVATMDSEFAVLTNGAIYVDGNTIAAVADRAAPPPAGFAGATMVDTAGIIFPGLIELHNHLSYDALELWRVPQKFTNRGQWQNNADYRANVSGPMAVIASSRDPHLLAAVARYAETKCLFGGVATSQGISLKGDNMQTSYRSAMRVVDDPADKKFPRARTSIPDVSASDWAKFKAELEKATCMLLHLSEGLDATARDAFLALKQGDQWAITAALAGIHCAALEPQDFAVMRANGASAVWSPLSNLLLYGGTTDIRAARAAGLDVALGSDWSPSGSKNLINELKVAKVANDVFNIGLVDRDIVAMATSTAARVVKWDALVGSVSAGKRADFTVMAAPAAIADPYASLINAQETDLVLLMIDGQPVLGTTALMSAFGQTGETVQLGSATRVINYGAGDPRLPALTFAQAKAAMADALSRLPTLLDDENKGRGVAGHTLAAAERPRLRLALDEEHSGGVALRPRLPFKGKPTGPDADFPSAATPVPLKPLSLDPPTVTDDPNYGAILQAQANILPAIKEQLKVYYG